MKLAQLFSLYKLIRREPRTMRKPLAKQPRQRASAFVLESLENRVLLSATPVDVTTTEPVVTAAVVTTDKADYAPGETALITTSNTSADGLKFGDGELVQFQVTRTDGIQDSPMGNVPWYVTDGVGGFNAYQQFDANGQAVDRNADGMADWILPDNDLTVNGSISTDWFVEDQYLGASLLLTATGQASGAVATTAFTDAGAAGTWSINDVTMSEGNAGTNNFIFDVTFNRTSNGSASVDWATAPGSINPATAGTDYTAASRTITFTGNTSGTQTVTVVVNGDTTFEPNETFAINLPTDEWDYDIRRPGRHVTNDDAATVTLTVTVTPPTLRIPVGFYHVQPHHNCQKRSHRCQRLWYAFLCLLRFQRHYCYSRADQRRKLLCEGGLYLE
jgi:hypothetical protein